MNNMNTFIILLSYIAMILSIVGNLYVNRKMVIGMWLWIFGSILWMIFATYSQTWSQLIMFSIYTILNIEGIIKWNKKD
jgi:hypothetical protein